MATAKKKQKPAATIKARQVRYTDWQTPDNLILLAGWSREGLSITQIAHNVGVAQQTLSKWKKIHNDIGVALKNSKEIADFEVENALFKRACGFEFTEVTTERKVDKDGCVEIKKREIVKYYPPDTGAAAFWLKNRQANKWKDRQIDVIGVQEDKLSSFIDLLEDGLKND